MAAIDLDAVKSAIAALEVEGITPSVRAVRTKVGGGSLTKILALMREAQSSEFVEDHRAGSLLDVSRAGAKLDVSDPEGLVPKSTLKAIEAAASAILALVPEFRSALAATVAHERTLSALAERSEAEAAVDEVDRLQLRVAQLEKLYSEAQNKVDLAEWRKSEGIEDPDAAAERKRVEAENKVFVDDLLKRAEAAEKELVETNRSFSDFRKRFVDATVALERDFGVSLNPRTFEIGKAAAIDKPSRKRPSRRSGIVGSDTAEP